MVAAAGCQIGPPLPRALVTGVGRLLFSHCGQYGEGLDVTVTLFWRVRGVYRHGSSGAPLSGEAKMMHTPDVTARRLQALCPAALKTQADEKLSLIHI